jgi:ATP/maltotriose-dependent transcriptional regulator MalT
LGANLCWQGRDHEAVAVLEQVVEVGRPLANNLAAVWALGCLGALRARADDLEAAEQYARQATDVADRHGLAEYWIAATALVTLADVLDRRGRTAEAEAAAVRGLELAQRGRARLETACALLCLARVGSRDGTIDDAPARVRAARQIIASCADPGVLTEPLARTERVLALRTGAASVARGRPAGPLSVREQEILRWLSSQLSLREIAGQLFLSPRHREVPCPAHLPQAGCLEPGAGGAPGPGRLRALTSDRAYPARMRRAANPQHPGVLPQSPRVKTRPGDG